jgi:hypothetical protein
MSGKDSSGVWKARTPQYANIIWMIIQEIVSNLTDSKKRMYKKDVYEGKYADNTASRKPRANKIKDIITKSRESALRDIDIAIDELLKEGKKNRFIATEIYRNQNNLVRNIMERDGVAGMIFTDQLFRAYEGANLIEEAKAEKKRIQDEIIRNQKSDTANESGEGFSSGDEVIVTDRDRAEYKRKMDMAQSKIRTTEASELTKAKKFIPTAVRNNILNELKLDSKVENKKQAVNNALQLITDTDDMTREELARHLNVLLGYVTTYNVGDTIRESIETLLINNNRQITTELEEKRKENIKKIEEREAEEKRKEEELRKEKEDRLLKSRETYEKEQYKQVDTEPTLTFAGVTLREWEWKLLLNIATNTVDDTLTANQRRLNRMRLNDKLQQYAERNNTNTPSVQSGLMEYKESLEPRQPGRQQRVFRPDSNVKTTTQFGFVAQSLGMLSNQLQDVKGEVTNASIKSQENFEKASEERYILYESLMEANNNIDIAITNLRQVGVDQRYLNNVETKLKRNLPNRRETKDILTPSQRGIILQAMPTPVRDVLSPMVNNLLSGGNIDMTVLVSGLVGLGFLSASGSSFGAQAIQLASGYLLNAFGIDLNDYLYVNNVSPPPATIITPLETPPPPVSQPLISREVLKKRVNENMGYEQQQNDIRNLMPSAASGSLLSDYKDLETKYTGSGSDAGNDFLSESDNERENLLNNLEVELLNNVTGSVELKMSSEAQQIIQSEARNYIRGEFSRFIGAISDQLTRRDNNLYDLLQFNEEVVSPLGFYDYLNNLRGLPDVVRQYLPNIDTQDLREAMPVMMDIKRSIPRIPQLPFMRRNPPDLVVPLGPDGFPVPDRGIIDRKNFPSGDEIKAGAYNAIAGGVVPAIIRDGAMGGVATIPAAGVGGAATGAITGPMVRRYYEQRGADLNNPDVQRQIRIIQALPPSIVGALIGYSGAGQNLFSGAGITERKITVDPSVLAETKGVDQQEGKDPKKWATKAIMPTPDILDETRQEKFVDDLEFAAFNYIEPGSEGANGNIKTNPLKRSQFLTDQIRYMDAGISTPSMLYNVEFPTNTPQKQMDTYKLGQDMLPRMEFLVDDNADTFTPIGRYYPNNNDTQIEMFSPFSNYSDVRNYWAINRKSDLYNLYA